MSTVLEMQIDELQEENDALKAINQKLQLEKNALKEQLALYGVVSSLFALIDEDNDIVMPLFLDEQKAIETRVKYLKDGLRKAITINRLEVV